VFYLLWLLLLPLPPLLLLLCTVTSAQLQIETALHEMRDLIFTAISEVRRLQVCASFTQSRCMHTLRISRLVTLDS